MFFGPWYLLTVHLLRMTVVPKKWLLLLDGFAEMTIVFEISLQILFNVHAHIYVVTASFQCSLFCIGGDYVRYILACVYMHITSYMCMYVHVVHTHIRNKTSRHYT